MNNIPHLPIPTLLRATNNYFIPSNNSRWIDDNGNIVKVTNVYERKKPIIICYKNIEMKDKKYEEDEISVSLHKFHSLFYSFEK